MMSLSKRSASLLLRISPCFLKLATITVFSIALAQVFEKTDSGKRWKQWLAALSEQPKKLNKWEDDYIMECLRNHQSYFSDLDFQTESESSDEGDTASEPCLGSSQELSVNRYKLRFLLQRSVSLPNISNRQARIKSKTNSQIEPYIIPDDNKEPSSTILAESSLDTSTQNSFSDISILQLSYIEAQNPWTMIKHKPQ